MSDPAKENGGFKQDLERSGWFAHFEMLPSALIQWRKLSTNNFSAHKNSLTLHQEQCFVDNGRIRETDW